MHAVLRDRYATANLLLGFGSLLPTALLLCLALASDQWAMDVLRLDPSHFKFLTACIAAFAFCCVLIQLQWKPDSKSDAHARAVDHFTNAKYDAQQLCDASELLDINAVRTVEGKYLDKRAVPPIPDAKFVWLKQRHLRKVDLSKRLDSDPWIGLPRWPWDRL
jgi:hypothetical protein